MSPFEHQQPALKPISLHVIHDQIKLIFKSLSKLYNQSPYCSDFLDAHKAILEHYKQALCYINKSLLAIQKQHPQSHIEPLDLEQIICLYPQYSYQTPLHLQPKISIESINAQIFQLTVQLDQLALIIRDCPDLENRFHILLFARAMTELFEIQQFYIYPFRPDLTPDYLKR